jgi:hypothetical protein
LRPQQTNRAVAYTNDALEWERTESINEGMNTANRALNVLKALRSQDYVTAFIRAMDIYMMCTEQVAELKARKLYTDTGKGRVLQLRHGQLSTTGQGIAGLDSAIERAATSNSGFFLQGGGGMQPAPNSQQQWQQGLSNRYQHYQFQQRYQLLHSHTSVRYRLLRNPLPQPIRE